MTPSRLLSGCSEGVFPQSADDMSVFSGLFPLTARFSQEMLPDTFALMIPIEMHHWPSLTRWNDCIMCSGYISENELMSNICRWNLYFLISQLRMKTQRPLDGEAPTPTVFSRKSFSFSNSTRGLQLLLPQTFAGTDFFLSKCIKVIENNWLFTWIQTVCVCEWCCGATGLVKKDSSGRLLREVTSRCDPRNPAVCPCLVKRPCW